MKYIEKAFEKVLDVTDILYLVLYLSVVVIGVLYIVATQ